MRKNKIIFFVCFLFSTINSFGQTVLDTDGLNNTNNIYLYSLKEYCTTVDSLKTKTIYVIRESFISDSWPTHINNFEIKYLTGNYSDIIKVNGGSLVIISISPLEFRKDKFYVSVIPFGASINNDNINLSNGGGLTVYFKYDNKKKGLIYIDKKWFGV